MEQISELEAHQRAYLQIFRAILKKKNAAPEQSAALLAKLKQYIDARIQSPDDFLDHIPNFARGLAVRPEALGAYIGSNFLPALEAVKKQMREAASASAARSAPAAGGGASPASVALSADAPAGATLFQELERICGTIVPENFRYVGEDMGLLRLVSLNGGEEIPSTSMRASMGMPAAETAGAEKPKAGAPAAAPAATSASAATAKPAAVAPMARKEASIIQEILEQFGDDLVVSGPLNVPAFPRNQAGAAPTGSAAPAAASAASAPAASSAGAPGAANGTASRAAAPPVAHDAAEVSILKEILEQFGDDLLVSGPLVLRDDNAPRPAQAGGGAGTAAAHAAPVMVVEEPNLPEIPLNFQQYMDVLKKLQEFQTTGDQAGYRTWLTQDAQDGGKALVGLRNVDAREKRGDEIHWQDEYYNIANHMHVKASQIAELHERIGRFQKLQQLLNQFIGGVKSRDPALVAAVKKIWPQVRLLFNDEWDADTMMSRLKIPLLQIMDPAVKAQVQTLMQPLLRKVESLAKAS